MALSTSEEQILWSTASNLSVAFGAAGTSDAFTYSTDVLFAEITCKADNDGTPASGDTVTFWLLRTTGDPDGASTEEYPTTGVAHKEFLCTLNTNSEDPAIRTVSCPVGLKGKIRAENNSAGRAITVSCAILEHLG